MPMTVYRVLLQRVPASPNTTKSTNPFNLNGESTSVQAPPVCTTLELILSCIYLSHPAYFLFWYADVELLAHLYKIKLWSCWPVRVLLQSTLLGHIMCLCTLFFICILAPRPSNGVFEFFLDWH